MENLNLVNVKSDKINGGIIRYRLFADSFLSREEMKEIESLKKSEFLELVEKKKWRAREEK